MMLKIKEKRIKVMGTLIIPLRCLTSSESEVGWWECSAKRKKNERLKKKRKGKWREWSVIITRWVVKGRAVDGDCRRRIRMAAWCGCDGAMKCAKRLLNYSSQHFAANTSLCKYYHWNVIWTNY